MLMEITGLYKDDKLMFACHKCSNKACVNPDHLYWGTRSDNTKDMFKEGVHNFLKMDLRGENHPLSKISDNDVLLARSMKNDGFTITEISKKLGYKKTTLNNIIYKNSKRFKHLLK